MNARTLLVEDDVPSEHISSNRYLDRALGVQAITQASTARLALHPKSTPSHPRIKSDRLLGANRSDTEWYREDLQRRHRVEDALSCFDTSGAQY